MKKSPVQKIFSKNGQVIGLVHLILDYPTTISSKSSFLAHLTKDIGISKVGYAGFKSKKGLQKHLEWQIFDKAKTLPQNLKPLLLDKETVNRVIADTLRKCHGSVHSQPMYVFVFPTSSKFVKEKMTGVTGFSPWKNTILIFIHPKCRSTRALRDTVTHEFAHAVTQNHHKWERLIDYLIFEGIAENFREETVGGKPAPWSTALTKEESKKTFRKLRSSLNAKSTSIYRKVFFGNKNYPLWAGYATGYHIVKEFRRKNPTIGWHHIFRLEPEKLVKN